jgi:hypothetical protein
MIHLFAVIAVYGVAADAPVPPSAPAVVLRAIEAEHRQESLRQQFTFREDHEETPLDKSGKAAGATRMTTLDVVMLEGEPYKKLILRDGQSLAAAEQKKVDEAMAKEGAERRKRRGLGLHRTVSIGDLDLLVKLFGLRVAGEESIAGRKVWRVEAEPKANCRPADSKQDQAMAFRKTLWCDREQGVIVKRDDVALRASRGFQPGSKIVQQYGYSKEYDCWLLETMVLEYDVKFAPLMRARGRTVQRYSGYKRFSVDSTITVAPQQ